MPNRPELRTLSDRPEELRDWLLALATGFLRTSQISEEEVEVRRAGIDPARTQGACDGGRWVATCRTFAQRMTVPGGATLPSCAISNVTVSPTHRRRGLLTAMVASALAAAKERGDACASLVSAEYPIYGRYGFGPSARGTEWEVEIARTGLDRRYSGPADDGDGGRVDIATAEEYRSTAPALHDRFRVQPQRQGAIDRAAYWWRRNTGELRFPGDGFEQPFYALYRDTHGEPQGAVAYTVDDHWVGKRPEQTASVHDLFATTAAGERALWRFVLSMDWVLRVRTDLRAPDDILPLLLPDPRAAKVTTQADFLWLRPLDVPRMLEARTYAVPGTLVLELRDEAGPAGGRFRLEAGAGADGAKCRGTADDPDVSMDVGELAALYLGDESAVRLAALGRVAEHREGAAATADTLFRTPRSPWCPDVF